MVYFFICVVPRLLIKFSYPCAMDKEIIQYIYLHTTYLRDYLCMKKRPVIVLDGER